MKSKNVLLLLGLITIGSAHSSDNKMPIADNQEYSWQWSPLTSTASWLGQNIVNNATPGNELVYTAGAGVIALGWMAYRWAYLKRPSWGSIVPDWLRRFGNGVLYTFGVIPLTGDEELLREQLNDNVIRKNRIETTLLQKQQAQQRQNNQQYNLIPLKHHYNQAPAQQQQQIIHHQY